MGLWRSGFLSRRPPHEVSSSLLHRRVVPAHDQEDLDFNEQRPRRRRSNDIANFAGFDVIEVDPDSLFTDEQRRTAFRVLAEEGNDVARAIERIDAEHSMSLTGKDLARWRDKTFSQLYVEVHSEWQHEIERELEARARENAIRSVMVGQKLIGRIDLGAEDADLLQAAKGLDAVTKHMAASTNTVLQLSGRPVDGASTNLPETLRALKAMGVLKVVDGTAEEVADAQVVTTEDDGQAA